MKAFLTMHGYDSVLGKKIPLLNVNRVAKISEATFHRHMNKFFFFFFRKKENQFARTNIFVVYRVLLPLTPQKILRLLFYVVWALACKATLLPRNELFLPFWAWAGEKQSHNAHVTYTLVWNYLTCFIFESENEKMGNHWTRTLRYELIDSRNSGISTLFCSAYVRAGVDFTLSADWLSWL